MSPENNLISQAVDSGIGVIPESRVTLSNSIEQVSDIDLYQFQLAKGQGITLDIDTVNEVNSTVNFDSYLRVFNADGQELAFNDDFTESAAEFSLDSYIGFIANTTEEYFVGVSNVANQDYNPINGDNINQSADNFIPSNYNLTLNIVEVVADDDPDNTITEAIETTIATTSDSLATIKGEINNNSGVDIYRLQLGEDEGISINLNAQTNGSELDSLVRLFDAEGKELALNDNSDDPNNITTDSAIAFAPHLAGSYFVGVSSAGNFDYDQVNGNTNLNLSPSTGISTGTYELRLEVLEVVADDDLDNTITEALDSSQIAAGSIDKVISEEIESELDVDLVKFELGQGEGVALEITTAENSELDSLLRLFDAAGNELTVDDNNDADFSGEFGTDSYLTFLPETPGEYYVGVGTSGNFDYDPVNGRTNFSSNVISPASTTGSYQLGINIIEVVADNDPDNTLAEALLSGVSSTDSRNMSLKGEIDPTSDVDLYRFQLQQGDGITIDINTAPDSALDSYLRLFDSEGNEIAFDNNEGRDFVEDSATDSLLTFTTDTSGEYFVGVSSNGNSEYDAVNGSNNFTPTAGFTTGSYDLSLNIATVIADFDVDNTINEAIETRVSSSGQKSSIFEDAIDSDTDVDLYQLQLNPGEVVDLDIDTGEFNSNLDSILQVFDADGNKLAFNDDSRIEDEFNQDAALVFTAPAEGKYYIGVSSFDNFDYDPLEGSDNFSGDIGSTTGEYQLAIAITDLV